MLTMRGKMRGNQGFELLPIIEGKLASHISESPESVSLNELKVWFGSTYILLDIWTKPP